MTTRLYVGKIGSITRPDLLREINKFGNVVDFM